MTVSTGSVTGTTVTDRLLIADNGDISFYEDTGTTPKLFWDASAESLGIGTSSPSRALSVFGDTSGVISITSNSTNGISSLSFGDPDDDNAGRVNYLNASNAMLFYTATAERMRISNAGLVGIGTDNPQNTLHLSSTSPQIKIEDTNATGYSKISGASANIYLQADEGNTVADSKIDFRVDALKCMVIDSGGDISFYEDTGTTPKFFWDASAESLGIGTTSPSAPLHIVASAVAEMRYGAIGPSSNSALRISRNDSTTISGNPLGYLEFGGNDATSALDTSFAYVGAEASGTHAAGDNPTDLVFGTTADGSATVTERMRIDAGGNVIMKGGRIKVRESDDGNDAVVLTRDADEGYVNVYSSGTQTVEIRGNGNSYFNGGNVGIGTSSPNEALHVYNATTNVLANFESGDSKAFISFKDNSTTNTDTVFLGADGNNMAFYAGSASSERMRIDASGNVGIGITPQSFTDLMVNTATDRNISIFDNAAGATICGITDAGASTALRLAGSPLLFTGNGGSGAEAMRIDASGNLGIGVVPSAWRSNYNILQIGSGGSLTADTTNESRVFLQANTYVNASNVTSYLSTDEASQYWQNGGTHIFNVAPSGTADAAVTWTTAMTIDNAGNVGIGVSNPLTKLHLDSPITNAQSANSSRSYKLLEGYGYTVGGNYYGQYAIGTSYNSATNTGTLEFFTGSGSSAPTERMRIDSLGNASFNTTNISPSANNVFGTALLQYGGASMSRTNSTTLDLNRSSSDGDIVSFRKDGTSVGSIGVSGGNNLFISGKVASHSGLTFATNQILPSAVGAITDAAESLGNSSSRFSDLYLSGGVYLGGTGADNLLEDYEEGTWTASVSAGAISGTDLRFQGSYTKVGRQVFISLFIDSTSGATDIQISSYASIAGIPFTIAKAGTSTVITEDIDVYARQGFAGLSGTTLAISAAGSSSGTGSLRIGIVGATA